MHIEIMKNPGKQSTSVKTSDRSKKDIERIHHMLGIAIDHIENKVRGMTNSSEEHSSESLDEVLSGLTKITALISKLLPIEIEMSADAHSGDRQEASIDEIDWDIIEKYLKKIQPRK